MIAAARAVSSRVDPDALMLVQRGVVRPNQLRGAWAGEVGQTQFMPSAYLMFATTPDGGGSPDLIHNSTDALASTANFLQGHGWQRGAGWDEGRTELRGHPAMEPRADLRQDRGVVCRQACRAIGGQANLRA